MECTENYVWGSPGVRDMSIFAKHAFWQRSLWVITIVEKSVKKYIRWSYQSTKRFGVGPRHKDITIILYYDIMIY